MKKILSVLALGALAAGTACSRIDANTSNTVPTADNYAATVTATHSGAGVVGTTADAYATPPAATSTVPGTMLYGTRTITEASFLTEAASSSMMELQLAKLALERSARPEVKEFARMIIDHHTKANQELTTLASGMNLTLPTALLPDHQKLVDKLSKLTGSEFDKKYADEMEEAHERDIALFEVVSNGAPTTTVKAFAIRTLAVLRMHEHHADKLDDNVE
ncbi:DUF4142 domain-containing protein [Rufibacter psychrotolerans]|uniref:DUF4142 domain-containing protein n=1 Tax=Rufibacter psychrotolerans TaxID=2812556 RepID=UPI0019687D18|nr:DUF4142 domain-containing protein [Rufibacter sp. SYSU D00308]